MGSPRGSGGSPAPIDRPILEYLRTTLDQAQQVDRATIDNPTGHLELAVRLRPSYYPSEVEKATLHVRWYMNDDFTFHYREQHADAVWKCRWDRHPNPHNRREHFHPPPDARTPGEDTSWPTDYRDVLRLVLEEIEKRIMHLWDQ